MSAQKLSAKEAAAELGTDARTLRKFLRSKASPIEPVGQGNRYEFTSKEVKALKKAFVSWGATSKPKTEKPPKDEDPEYDETEVEVEDEPNDEVDFDDEDTELDDLDGPTDEELLDEDDVEIELIDLDD